MAQNIPGARFVEVPGTDHTVIDNETQDVIAGHIEEFITGERQPSEPDRVLATVMFTDIVGSTQRAAEVGDSRWRQLLDDWYTVMRKELTRFSWARGRHCRRRSARYFRRTRASDPLCMFDA